MSFKNKIVIVTGSTQGIGKAIAEAFAQEGAVAVILGRNGKKAEEIKAEIISKSLKAECYRCDVTNLKNVQEIVTKILDKYKRVDILINNAGITKDNLLIRMSEEDWDDVVQVNLKGLYNCTKAVVKAMLKAKNGRIINISSIIGITGNTGQTNYAATKAGTIGFTKSIAKELASRGITANAIAPGYIQTDMTAKLDDIARAELIKRIPLGTLGPPQDVANTCLFLASEEGAGA